MQKNPMNWESSEPSQMKRNTPFTLHICALLLLTTQVSFSGVQGTTFTFVNRCNKTVWPGIVAFDSFGGTGFELPKGTSRSFEAPNQFRGQLWGRTGCNFDPSGRGSCVTGDCGSGRVECNGTGTPPLTLVEFSLDVINGQDFYDVSLVNGFNLPVKVEPEGGSGLCESTGCISDLNRICPEELKVGAHGCLAPCQALGRADYCCIGPYNSPDDCKPNVYSEMFKVACPRSYSYAYDDATSTYTCTDANYTVTFCPYSSFSSL